MRRQGLWMSLRLALITGVLLAVVGAAITLRTPVAHAAVIGPGGCTYYHLHDEGYFHTNLCVNGPYYDSAGKYYTFTGSCWLTSAQTWQQTHYPYFDLLYKLGCTQKDNVKAYNWLYTYKAFCSTCTPSVPVMLTMSSQRAPAGRTVQIYTNGYTSIDIMDNETGTVAFGNPSDGAVSQQYLP